MEDPRNLLATIRWRSFLSTAEATALLTECIGTHPRARFRTDSILVCDADEASIDDLKEMLGGGLLPGPPLDQFEEVIAPLLAERVSPIDTLDAAPGIRGGHDSENTVGRVPSADLWVVIDRYAEVEVRDGHSIISPGGLLATVGNLHAATAAAERVDGVSIVLPAYMLPGGEVCVGVSTFDSPWPADGWLATMRANAELGAATVEAFAAIARAHDRLQLVSADGPTGEAALVDAVQALKPFVLAADEAQATPGPDAPTEGREAALERRSAGAVAMAVSALAGAIVGGLLTLAAVTLG